MAAVIACGGDSNPNVPAPTVRMPAEPTSTLMPSPTVTPADTPAPLETPTLEPTSTPGPTPTSSMSREMTSADIYEALHQSVAHIQTPTGAGSGFLIEGGYVITNHHVIWPFEEARVVFPDGTDLTAPVVAWDPMSDTAVLGPVDVDASPLQMQDGEGMRIGGELFLLGYPGELGPSPTLAIASGVLSGIREWSQPGITYFQTNAAVAGGQSGGVLVNRKGEVIGVSGLTFTEAQYALVASAADLEPIVQQLILGKDPWGVGNRSFLEDGPGLEFSATLRNHWDSAMFVLDAGSAGVVEFEIDCPVPASFHLADQLGNVLLDVDNGLAGSQRGNLEVSPGGRYFLAVETALHSDIDFDINSSARVRPFRDPDDGRRLELGDPVAGSIDYPGDLDWYSMRLEEGDTVRIRVDSWLVDTTLHIDFAGSYANQVAYDDDSGSGLFKWNSEVVYRAPMTGEYLVAVQDQRGDEIGGYFLSMIRATADPYPFIVPPGPPEVDSPLGDMVVIRSPLTGFSVQAPSDWTQARPGDGDPDIIFRTVAPKREGILLVREFDLSASDKEQRLGEFMAELQERFSERGIVPLHEETSFTPSGNPRAIVKFRIDGDQAEQQLLVGLKDERYMLMVQYSLEDAESLGDLADYSFGTLVSSGLLSSPNFGQYFKGRTLHLNLVSLERLPELRYSTINPNGVVRQWALFPADPASELVLARLKVENHTQTSVNINVHGSAAELHDSDDRSHYPVAVAETVWQDFHGEQEALVRVDRGDCFDGGRALIEPGTAVRWQSESDAAQYLAFENASVAIGPGGRAELPPGESVSHTFHEPGTYRYACENRFGRERPGVVQVVPADDRASVSTHSLLFLNGYFELLKGYGLDGYMVFEAPSTTEFSSLRWLAGDSITIRVLPQSLDSSTERKAAGPVDRETLTALYNATDGQNWQNNGGWLSDQPVGEWYGVVVNTNGRVVGLYLDENRLNGEIPPELGRLSGLELLRLSNNRLGGGIPAELGSLTNLTSLFLNPNPPKRLALRHGEG